MRETVQSTIVGIRQASRIFRVHHQTIRKWLQQGAPHFRVGKIIRVDLLELRAWADGRHVGRLGRSQPSRLVLAPGRPSAQCFANP